MKRFTIKDIARRLGVNPSTVSRALKDHPDIGPALREEIKKTAVEMNYKPNPLAVQLRQGGSRQVGLVVPEMTMFFYPSVIKGIEEVLHAAGYYLMILASNESNERELENLHICMEQDMAGVLLSLSRHTHVPSNLEWMLDSGIPVVLFDKIMPGLPLDSITLEDSASTVAAVNKLIHTQCANIGGIFGNPNLLITQLRLDGFRLAVRRAGIAFDESKIRFADDALDARKAMEEILALPHVPDGLFIMSDEILIGAMPVLSRSGIRIPEECSVICISDGFLPYCLYPQVSFMHHDGQELGRIAARQLLHKISLANHPGFDPEPGHIKLETKLVELQTTR